MNSRKTKYEQRKHLAIKWHYIDHLEAPDIQERLVAEGHKEVSLRTIREYLRSTSANEVQEQLKERFATTREQIADRQERLYKRARDAELSATELDEKVATRPKSNFHGGDSSIEVREWEVIEPGDPDYPDDATPWDKYIRFTGGTRTIQPGESYYLADPDGEPIYTASSVGVREIADERQRSFLRREQAHHLELKGEILGLYDDEITISGKLDVESDVTVPDEIVSAITVASRAWLRGDDVPEGLEALTQADPDDVETAINGGDNDND